MNNAGLKKRILKDASLLDTLLDAGGVEPKDVISDVAVCLLNALNRKQEDMNSVLRYLLNAAHGGAENIKLIGDALGAFNLFEKLREWLDANKLSRIGQSRIGQSRIDSSLACRLLDFMRLYPQEASPKYLEEELQSVMERADARINTDAADYSILFAKLIETLGQSAAFSVTENETEFNQKYISVQNIINEQRERRLELKKELDGKYGELAGTEDEQEQNNIFFEIQILQRRLKKPLYTTLPDGGSIPAAFIIYCIAIDENPHFSPMARLAAFYRVCRAENAPAFFKQKIEERYADFVTCFHYQVPCLKDATRGEFARELEKGLAFFGADTDRKNIDALVEKISRAMPRWQEFFNEHPLSIADASQCGQCALFPQRPYALNCRTKYKAPAGSGTVDGRHIEISDLTQPNAAPLPFTLFNNHTIALAALLREYLRYQGIYNEAEVWINISYCLKAALTPEELAAVHAPLFRVIKPDALRYCASLGEKICKAKELIETRTMFIEIFVRPPPAAPSAEDGAGEFTRDDAGLLLGRHFNLNELNAGNLLFAKITADYIAPLAGLPALDRLHDDNIKDINNFIESVYGKRLNAEEAAARREAVIAAEDKNIEAMNDALSWHPEIKWPLLQNSPAQKKTITAILTEYYTQTNTISAYDLDRIKQRLEKADPKKLRKEKRRERQIAALSGAVFRLEKHFPQTIKKLKMSGYDKIFDALERCEKSLDVCGWRAGEERAVCRRSGINCCETGMKCRHLGACGCSAKSLSCKLWLCGTALSSLHDLARNRKDPAHKNAARFLKHRERDAFLCRAFSIPLKIRCSKEDSFRAGKGLFADLHVPHWADTPLRPAPPSRKPQQNRRPRAPLKPYKIRLKMPDIKHLNLKVIVVIIGLLVILAAVL